MLNNETIAKGAAAFRKDSGKEFDKAVAALIALAYRYQYMGEDFLWEKDPELNDEANRICIELSDALAERAKAIAKSIVTESLEYYDFEEDWDYEEETDTDDDNPHVPVLVRFDQQGSFLKELLEIWIALAFVHSLTQGELRVMISRYLANPFASPLWKNLPKDILNWGRGFAKDIKNQIAIIGQNAIVSAARRAEWEDARAKGATYYIRQRGSNYECPECDSLCGYPIPIDEPFEFVHSHCMCIAEYHYD
jgi:hypothetical protein